MLQEQRLWSQGAFTKTAFSLPNFSDSSILKGFELLFAFWAYAGNHQSQRTGQSWGTGLCCVLSTQTQALQRRRRRNCGSYSWPGIPNRSYSFPLKHFVCAKAEVCSKYIKIDIVYNLPLVNQICLSPKSPCLFSGGWLDLRERS